MKDIFELATGTAAVTAITPKVISATMEEIARGKNWAAQFYKVNTDLKNTGGTEVTFPKKGSGIYFTTNISPGGGITATSMSYTSTTIKIAKHGVGLEFQGEAIRQVKRDILRDQLIEAGEAYADCMDTLAIEAMYPRGTFAANSSSLCDAPNTFIVGIVSTVGNCSGATLTLKSTGSSIYFGVTSATITAWYLPSTTGCSITASDTTGKSITAKDLRRGYAAIQAYNYVPSVVVVHPEILTDIIYDPSAKFIEAWAYRGAGPLLNNEIGQIWDLKLVVSNKAPMLAVPILSPKDLGYCVERMDLDMKKDEVTGMSADVLRFWGFVEKNYGVVNERSYGAVIRQGSFPVASYIQPTL
jgi:N4-gp56 family major capsid protein